MLSHRTLVFPSCKSQYQCHAGHIHATNNMPSTSHIIQLHVRKLGHRGIELLFTFRSVKANAFAATSSSHCCSVTLLLCYRNRCRRHCRRKDFCFLKHSNSGCCRPTNCQYTITSKRTGLVTWLLGCGCVRLCAVVCNWVVAWLEVKIVQSQRFGVDCDKLFAGDYVIPHQHTDTVTYRNVPYRTVPDGWVRSVGAKQHVRRYVAY